MTVEEAKKKWCPMIRPILTHDSDGNRYYTNNRLALKELTNCIASDCMMWRWYGYGAEVDGKYDSSYPIEGCCGLGGRP